MSPQDSRIVFLFPGQGGYLPGVLAQAETNPDVSRTLAAVDRAAAAEGGPTVTSSLTERDAPSLSDLVDTDPARLHLAIFATAMAVHARLVEDGTEPDLLMGHSFGEFAALTAAGCMDLDTGVALVCQRDFALRAAVPQAGGMLTLATGRRRAEQLVAALDDWHLSVAADNGPDQVVVSGPHESLDRLATVAEAVGVGSRRLRVPYPFHNRLLGGAAERFERVVRDTRFRAPRQRVYSPTLRGYVETAEDAAEVLAGHLLRPVRFLDAVYAVRGDGYRRFTECGARSVLVDLVATAVVDAETTAPLRGRVQPVEARPKTSAAQAASRAVPEERPAARGTDTADVLGELRSLYADAVGYPVDVFEPGTELEADLGIDSIRQTELLVRVLEKYSLPREQVRITEYTTLESVAELVAELSGASAAV